MNLSKVPYHHRRTLLPRFRPRIRPDGEPTRFVYAFKVKKADLFVVIGDNWWSMLPTDRFAAEYMPTNREARNLADAHDLEARFQKTISAPGKD